MCVREGQGSGGNSLMALFSQPPIFLLVLEESGKMSRLYSLCWRVSWDTEQEKKGEKLI